MGRWITIHVPYKLAEAHLIAAILEAEGVRALVENESLYFIDSELGSHIDYSPRVQVLESQRERALAVLRERGVVDAPESDPHSPAKSAE